MSFLTEMTTRRMAAFTRTRITTTIPRASFTTSLSQRKNVVDAGKDTLKNVDRAVSDKLVDGIDAGVAAKDKVKETAAPIVGKAQSEASKLTGEAQGKASELKGKAEGNAASAKGTVDEKAGELKGKAKEKVNEL
ncbi:unnamed protein product [Discula destructiva]